MTDRKPDDLYDALRDRLANYGQEPPAPLWANIRAQLPAPVAAPRLRQRARRRQLAALLLLLLVGLGTWQWWPPGRHAGQPTGQLATRTPVAPAARQPTEPAATAPAQAPLAAARAGAAQPTSADAPRQAAVGVAATAATGAADASGNLQAAATTRGAMSSSRRRLAATTSADAPPSRALATTRAVTRTQASEPDNAANGVAAVRTAGKSGSNSSPSGTVVASNAGTTRATGAARGSAPMVAQLPADAGKNSGSQPEVPGVASQPAVGATAQPQSAKALAAKALATEARQVPQPAAELLQATQATGQLAEPRAAALLLQPAVLPSTLTRADTLPPLPAVAVRRWAVQALAGPAHTSRTLGGEQLAYSPQPTIYTNPANGNPSRSVFSTKSVESEQAATGYGLEAQLQRQLNGRWSLGTGLGYHAFATTQTVSVRVVYGSTVASNFRPDSVGTTLVRNTYRFLTLPLRVGYQLGTGRGRLRYGLRAGADLAFYLGGRSTEGTSYGSSSRSWGATGSPYRPLSLALSLGAEVRYRLAPGWELLAQPTLTHFATSVARPASGYVPRYPLAATALVGVAYWLR